MSFVYTCDYCGETIDDTAKLISLEYKRYGLNAHESTWLGHYLATDDCYGHVQTGDLRRGEPGGAGARIHPDDQRAGGRSPPAQAPTAGLVIAAMSKHKAYAYLRRDPCSYCGACPAGAIDHIIPRARGGGDEPGNLTAGCSECGALKGCWPLLPFLLIRPWAASGRGERMAG